MHLSPSCSQPKELGKEKSKCSLCHRYFVRACVWALQIKQVKGSKVVHPHFSYTEGGWNLFGDIFTSLQRQLDLPVPLLQSPVLSPQTPPAPKSSTQDITVLYLNLFHLQMTGKKCD